MENKLNDLKPLYSHKKNFEFQKKLRKLNAVALEGKSCRLE